MLRPQTIPTTSGDDLSTIGKTEVEPTASTASSDIKVDSSGFWRKQKGEATFVTKSLGKDYSRPVETYEGIHRYDPDFDWEPEEEKKVVRKVRRNLDLKWISTYP